MKYSVIIPAFHAEKTLRRCLASIPVRPDAEIILIDDGSTDATGKIAAEFKNVRYIHTEHRGVSAARNLGLDLARGEFVTFVDSDDWVAPSYFDRMDRTPAADILVFEVPPRRGDPVRVLFRSRRLDSVCNKRFRRSFLEENRVRFQENLAVGEDFLFCFSLLCKTSRIILSEECVYHADLENENSLSRGYRPRLAEDLSRMYVSAARLGRYLPELDFWHCRGCLSALAELWKVGWPSMADIRRVCDCFRQPLGPARGFVHRLLRMAVRRKWDAILAAAAFLGKGWRFWRKGRF